MNQADTYHNSPGGLQIYDKKVFSKLGISLKFVVPQDIRYEQFSDRFFPGLSIIDVMMNCGLLKTREFLEYYDLL